MLFIRHRYAAAVSVIVAAFAGGAYATPPGGTSLSLVNPGFESNPVAPGCFAVLLPTGWSVYDPNGIQDMFGDVVGCAYADGSVYYPVGGAPEGVNVALVFLSQNVGVGPMGLTQLLADVLEPNTTYTLRAQIGNIASGQGPPPCDVFGFFNLNGFPGYRAQLLAGGVVILEDNNSLNGMIPDGEFRRTTVQTTIGETHPQLGAALEVRLINLNTPGTPASPGIEVNFDDIQLWTGCFGAGDLDDNGDVNATDLQLFVDVLLQLDADPLHVSRADADCSSQTDGDDITAFVALFIGQ
ncbi:MAG: hypothetical protein AABZ08_10415 [Planctomycetota bacterium]